MRQDIKSFLANGLEDDIGDLPRRHRLSHGLLEALHHGLRLGGQRLLNRGVLEPGRAVALRVQNVCTHEAGAEDGHLEAGAPQSQFIV